MLVRATGRSLCLCRQELFIAEGNVGEAYVVLVARDVAPSMAEVLH